MPPAGAALAGGDPHEFIMGGIGLVGSLVAGMQDVDEALEIAANGGIKLDKSVPSRSLFPPPLSERALTRPWQQPPRSQV